MKKQRSYATTTATLFALVVIGVVQASNLKKLLPLVFVLRSAALLAVSTFALLINVSTGPPAQALVPLPFAEEGELDGVPYRIVVPLNWNGTLLVFAHGWIDRADHPGEVDIVSRTLAPPTRGDRNAGANLVLANGYALAQSAFRNNGYAVQEGLQNSLALTGYFKDRVGKPTYSIFWGASLGGLIALEAIEKFPAIYDAAIAFEAPLAGGPRLVDWSLAFALAYRVTFFPSGDWPSAWGEFGNLRDDLDETKVFPILSAQMSDEANYPKFDFIRRVSRIPLTDFFPKRACRYHARFRVVGGAGAPRPWPGVAEPGPSVHPGRVGQSRS